MSNKINEEELLDDAFFISDIKADGIIYFKKFKTYKVTKESYLDGFLTVSCEFKILRNFSFTNDYRVLRKTSIKHLMIERV